MTTESKPHSSALFDAKEYLIAGLENQAEWWEHLGDAHRDYASLARAAASLEEQYEIVTQERDQIEKSLADEMRQKAVILKSLRGIEEQLEALKLQADLDAERAAILSSAVGRARLILGDASKETTALIDAAVASYPAKEPSDAV